MTRGLIFDIQHFSLHDGPGIRTTVFLKGCSLNCAWCHNPESIAIKNSLMFEENRCIGCRACETVCGNNVHFFTDDGRHKVDFSRCSGCGECQKVCFAGALKMIASSYDTENIVSLVLRDRGLYEKSGGGVTFSGGEPLLQAEFVSEAAQMLKEQEIHVAIDTALNVPRENIDLVMPYADLFLCDLKAVSEDIFRKYIGNSNERIMENLRYVASKKNVFIRTPVVKGVNDSMSELTKIRDVIDGLGENVKEVGLLSYHDLGVNKALKVGMEEHRFEIQGSGDFTEKLELFKDRGYRLLFDGSEVR